MNDYFVRLDGFFKSHIHLTLIIVNFSFLLVLLFILYFKKQKEESSFIPLSIQNQITSTEKLIAKAEIAGAVLNPGVYEIEDDFRLVDLIRLAGGFTQEADTGWIMKNLNLAQNVSDVSKVYVPFIWDIDVVNSTDLQPYIYTKPILSTEPGTALVVSDVTSVLLINVNKASQEELETLSGVGPAYASKIISNRPYIDFDDFKEKSGLSVSLVSKLEEKIEF